MVALQKFLGSMLEESTQFLHGSTNRHHPDTQDLTGAEEFARGVLAG